MADHVMDQIVAGLRATAPTHYPELGELRNVRVVGHTPKSDHYIHDIVIDCAGGSARLAAKVYRGGKNRQKARAQAEQEARNLAFSHQIALQRGLSGIPRPIGDFVELGVVVSEKLSGVPMQSMIMRAALLPAFADQTAVNAAAILAGEWLRRFHNATAGAPSALQAENVAGEMERLCSQCRSAGLDETSISMILSGARTILAEFRGSVPASAVLNDFCPLNIVIGEYGAGFGDFARLQTSGGSFDDVAGFMANVEALEKYPFCNRDITTSVQARFAEAYGVSAEEKRLMRVLKMRALLTMFARGRTVKESALRKKVMWATVMKRFIQQAAEREMAAAA